MTNLRQVLDETSLKLENSGDRMWMMDCQPTPLEHYIQNHRRAALQEGTKTDIPLFSTPYIIFLVMVWLTNVLMTQRVKLFLFFGGCGV